MEIQKNDVENEVMEVKEMGCQGEVGEPPPLNG